MDETITDPQRIGTLLRDEIEGLADPPFDSMVVESKPGDTPGETVFAVTTGDETLFTATHGPERLVLEFARQPEAIGREAEAVGLRTRPKATTPPSTIVFVERAAAVKRVIDVLRTTHRSQ